MNDYDDSQDDEPAFITLDDATTKFLFNIWLRRNPPMPDRSNNK